MTKKGIVKSVQSNGTWEGKYGLMYLYEVTINEDSGQYMSKSDNQTKFIKGQEVEYEYTGGQYPKIKPAQTFEKGNFKPSNASSGGFDTQRLIVKQNALTNACNIIGDASDLNKIIETAEVFSKWVLNDERPSKVEKSNDLPF